MRTEDSFYRMLLDHIYDGVYFVDRERRISFWNKGAERITGYTADEVLGKGCADNLLRHIDQGGRNLCRGGCPLSEALGDGKDHTKEIYLLHKEGHRVPISVRVTPMHDNTGAVIGAVEIFSDNTSRSDMLDRIAEIERLAYKDPLTDVANRRYTDIALAARHEEMERYGWPFGVIFIDIDNFKHVNDRYGHAAGDDVLRMVARTLAHSARSFDVVGRWGGEEFLVLVANVGREELLHTAERFRVLVERSKLPGEHGIQVTISLGASLARTGESLPGLLSRADRLLYASKAAGRNRVTCGE